MDNSELTILHVEDDPRLANLVRTAFTHFGFRGALVSAGSVAEAMRILIDRERGRTPMNLILSDMQLPDGTGLDLIRDVKSDPALRVIPIIILSHDLDEAVVNDAYALGANSYLPKVPALPDLHGSLKDIYQYWLDAVQLPRAGSGDRLQEALERAIGLRTRTAEFYLRLASAFPEAPEESAFWLDRALNEGNLSNLLAFFRNKVKERDVPPDAIDRLYCMQLQVTDALRAADEHLTAVPAPAPVQAYQWAFALTDALDEEVFAEALGILFPVSSIATTALKARTAAQIENLASYIWARTRDEQLRRKADELLDWSRRLRSDH